jgi:hypothetical protein
MNKEELVRKNLELSSEFGKYMLDNPELAERIPKEAVIIFIDESDSELTRYNLSLAKQAEKEGRPIIKVRIKGLVPDTTRLLEPKLEFSST